MKKKIYIAILLIFILLTSFSYGDEKKKVVLLLINEINYEDLYNLSAVKNLIDEGSIGFLNTRSSGGASAYKSYATLGAGTRAEASPTTISCFEVNDQTKNIYKRRTGADIKDNGIINIDIPALRRLNEAGDYGAIAGSLGQSLHNQNKKTAAIGNGDIQDDFVRLAPIVAMDEKGYVDYGSIGKEILIKDDTYPFGLKSDFSKMMDVFEQSYNQSDLVVIDVGDMNRLERYKPNLSDEMYIVQKQKILKDANDYINKLVEKINFDHTRLILLTPYPASDDIKTGNRLTPVIFYGDGITKGIVTSSTTRRVGIIGNVDIAPSIARYLHVDTNQMSGQEVRFIEKNDSFAFLMNLKDKIVSTSINRGPVLSTFAIFEIIVSIVALLFILFEKKINKNIILHFKNILLSTMAIPFVLLILPIFNIQNIFVTYILGIGLVSLIIYMIKQCSKNILDGLFMLSFITTVGLLLDILMNATLIKNSLLGYDPIIGARYYGVGNEYMGILIGSTLVLATIILDRFKISKIWSIVIFLVTILIIGYPKLGANVGGTIAAVAAFIFTSLRLFKIKIKLKQFVVIGIAVVFVVSFMAFIDIRFSKNQSHLAGAIEQIISSGPGAILLIIRRKLEMNAKLIGVTIWSKVLLSAIIILATLFYRPVGTIYKLSNKYPNLSIGWSGIVMASIVAFFVNDSGVVAAATGIIFLVMSMLYLTLFGLNKDS
ncbi:hypothetical protein [Anaerophilus nitritogenes]|uniref:hypothetical protein n=1 Tax=Anaerophilus nitritogenes TaxID=2498136 RepID=UPI00101DA7A6|nr:hypothetical protein [Anaerophilus nitritogenes]